MTNTKQITIHYLNGNDTMTWQHYEDKEYRNDIIIEYGGKNYEIYCFTPSALEYEMTKDGFFSLPGLIILESINKTCFYAAIKYLIKIGYFESFAAIKSFDLNDRFYSKWYHSSWNRISDTVEFEILDLDE